MKNACRPETTLWRCFCPPPFGGGGLPDSIAEAAGLNKCSFDLRNHLEGCAWCVGGTPESELSKLAGRYGFSACVLRKRLRRVGAYEIKLPEDFRSPGKLFRTIKPLG